MIIYNAIRDTAPNIKTKNMLWERIVGFKHYWLNLTKPIAFRIMLKLNSDYE